MKRLPFVVAVVMSVALAFGAGCAAKRSGCGGCKTPCDKAPGNPCGAAKGPHADFGNPLKLTEKDTVCVKEVLANPEQFKDKFIRVAGKVDSVCAHKGCWLRLGDGEQEETLFVKFTCPVKGRLIPADAQGKAAFVEGTLELKEIPQAEARHYKEDAGASAEEIAKIVGPQKIIKLSAPSARIMGLKPDKG